MAEDRIRNIVAGFKASKPDIDQIMKNEFQNVLNTERVNLDPASITTKDYPKANYEVTATN